MNVKEKLESSDTFVAFGFLFFLTVVALLSDWTRQVGDRPCAQTSELLTAVTCRCLPWEG